MSQQLPERRPPQRPPAPPPPRVSSRELFKDGKGIEIEHHGRIYHLRITQLGKLILTA